MNSNSMLSTTILSGSEKELIKYIDETILKINKHNSRSLLDNLFEVNQLEPKVKLLAIARMEHIIGSYKNLSQIIIVMSVLVSILTFIIDKNFIDGQVPTFFIVYVSVLGVAVTVTGFIMIHQKSRIDTATFFKSLLEKSENIN